MNPNIDLSDDGAVMQYALDLAEHGRRTTHPNPLVGCVIVNNGKIVGEGFHHTAGEPHAERIALKKAGSLARGATAYVNLEPCCHQGRTPPCTDGLIDAGIGRVVTALQDPNPLVAGGGFDLLSSAGVEVTSGVLEDQARWQNRGFISRMLRKRPWVKIKTAATLDGRTADVHGASQWISCDAAREQVQVIRSEVSALVTGVGTIIADDPLLTVRLDDTVRQPTRVVLDSNLSIPLASKTLTQDGDVIVVCTPDAYSQQSAKVDQLELLGVEILKVKSDEHSQIDLKSLLDELSLWQFNEVLVEAGAKLSGAFIEQNLVDELLIHYGASVLGGHARGMFDTKHALSFSDRPTFKIVSTQMLGESVQLVAANRDSVASLVPR